MSHKYYLAGPMTNIPLFNFPAFNAAAKHLRSQGHEVFNPAERDIERHAGVDISAANLNGDPTLAAKQHSFSLREAPRRRYQLASASHRHCHVAWLGEVQRRPR